LQKALEERGGFSFLDSAPKTITGQEHRPAILPMANYFSNPNAEDVFEGIYTMMNEVNPKRYPQLY